MTAYSSPSDSPAPADLQTLFDTQRAWRWRAAQTTAAQRQVILRRVHDAVRAHREALAEALSLDLGKSRAESEIAEIHPILEELRHAVQHLPRWMAPRRVPTPLMLAGSHSEVQMQARGVTLILSPWNYPVNLALAPLIASLAAGNTVVLKPSEKAPHVARALKTLLESVFEPRLVAVVEGDANVARTLTSMPFDHIFFTGSTAVGRQVMSAAAQNLTGVTLELGGKSPALVHSSAHLTRSAERLTWGKFLNAGQTCVAPDYALVPRAMQEQLVGEIGRVITRRFGDAPRLRAGTDYGRMVDAHSVRRLDQLTRQSLEQGARLALGGDFDPEARFISPTVVTDVTPDMPLMQEELFGPVLPVLTYDSLEEALNLIRRLDPPLALYLFAENDHVVERVQRETTSGGMIVNGTIIHLTNPYLPFGGVGTSGQGAYHGEHGFRTFSHQRAVLTETPRSGVRFMYPPYGRPLPRLAAWALRQLERQSGSRGG
ncbi:aldehyde dehydrogenase family protein [Deinococcus deserti]|uniref:Aldehyde dehydrogenase n=1 Tax=Deinococcus deserti (strain DSM 17065 / CIP 109153 / LMG 22923 / VCD115) TaxID=546414 RepID=C1CYV8_DEIDV|nr:aldehyde dehydrogenase family protein [Deinococcus deserti]ACO47138.2 putative NAD-dependent aldehyde dehydrogenase [Deinococcus deserti VCD115]